MKQIYVYLISLYRSWLITIFILIIGIIAANAQVKGVVFRDFDLNGVRSDTLPIEVGVQGVIVRAFVDLSKTPISTTTTADGTYLFSSADVPAGKPVRLEFSNFLTGDYNGPYGASSATNVQFVKSPSENANLGVNYPADYCQRVGKMIVIPCYVNGNSQLTTDKDGNAVPTENRSAAADALVSFPYESSGIAGASNYPPNHLASAGEVGTIWALSYQRRTKSVFSAAVVKRHASFGPAGPSGLYKTDIASGTTTTFMSVSSVGIDMGADPHTDPLANLFGDKTQASTDPSSISAMGRMSFGGMDMSEDDRTLYFVNLKDRKVYGLFINSPAVVPTSVTAVQSWAIPNPGCSNGDYRPWALKVHHGYIYVGVICSAEKSQLQSDLKATIYRFDPKAASPVFTEVLSFPLDFRRGPVDLTGTCIQYDHWLPWSDTWPAACGAGDNPKFVMYPQPMLTSMAFDDQGSLLIGFLDRFGHLAGVGNHDPQGNGSYDGFTGGDLLKAYNTNGKLVLEQNGKSGSLTGSGVGNNEGPGGGEFFGNDYWLFFGHTAHAEITNGAISMVPGYKEVVSSAFDPITDIYQSGGLKVFNTDNGTVNRNYVLYTATPGAFGKASGLGDSKPLCDASPVEIGNRFWFDDNRDGVQDAYEPGIDGIKLTLHDMESGGTQLATQTTHDGGQFYFNNTTVPTGLKFGHKYQIRMDTTQLSPLDITLGGVKTGGSKRYYAISPSDRTNFTDADLRDSDARLAGSSAVIDVTTLEPGQNDFTNDLAIYSCPQVTNEKHSIDLCAGTKLDSIVTNGNYLSRVDSVRFVVFSSPQSGTAMYGNGGTTLGTVKPDANNRAVLRNPAFTTANSTSGIVSQYVYAIIFPIPENPACRQADETIVKSSPALSVSATGGKLTCTVKSLTLSSQALYGNGSAAPNAVYRWTGPTSFTSSLQNPTVSVAGSYTVTVSSLNCPTNLTMAVATVTSETAVPDLVAYGNALPCPKCTATLLAEAPKTPGVTFFWKGPNSFTSTAAEPTVSIPGEYTVTAKGVSGCEISATAELLPIESDPCQPLSVSVTGGKLTCTVKSLTLTSKVTFVDGSAAPAVVYLWTGPNSFTSSLQNPIISTKGSYTLTASIPDCPTSQTVAVTNITSETAVPDLVAYGNALPCPKCSATLLAEAPGATFTWTGPKGFTSTEAEPTVTVPGDYTVTATGATGCKISISVELLPIESDDPCVPVCIPISIKRIR